MAPFKHVRGVKILLKAGDGGDPEQFAAPCSLNADRGITFTAGTNEEETIDCADPEKVAWLVREKTNLSAAFTGAGLLNTSDLKLFYDWYKNPDSQNAKVIVDVPSADGGLVWSGAWHLTEFAVTGSRGSKAQVSISLASDGEISDAPNA